jgi:hypothetical protein
VNQQLVQQTALAVTNTNGGAVGNVGKWKKSCQLRQKVFFYKFALTRSIISSNIINNVVIRQVSSSIKRMICRFSPDFAASFLFPSSHKRHE